MRSVAFFEARGLGTAQRLQWAKIPGKPKERRNALVGIAQSLLREKEDRLEERLLGGWSIGDGSGDFVGEIE